MIIFQSKVYNFSKLRMIKCLLDQILDTADMSLIIQKIDSYCFQRSLLQSKHMKDSKGIHYVPFQGIQPHTYFPFRQSKYM